MNFNRIISTIDVDAMQESHVTIVGSPIQLTRDLVHSGLWSVIIVDFDRIDASNPARQDFYATDLGRYKAEATAVDLRKINPEVEVEYHTRDYCALSREEHDALFGHTDLFIFATDFLPAQARGNIEAIRMGKPAIWIGLYRAGRAGEIVYYVPGVTAACYRCICSDRYRAFAGGAIAGQIAVGILTRGADNRMGKLIEKLGNRNLLQVKIDPDYRLGDKDLFGQYLGDHPANFSFTTIALPMERDEQCPDCACIYESPTREA